MNKAFHPGEVWTDTNGVAINAHGGGVLFHEGTYYWFGEHKIEGTKGNRSHVGFHVYASENLLDWRDEGIALAVDDSPGSEIPTGSVMERPKVIYNARTGKFVMWFHLEPMDAGYSGARCAVAVADQATGPYRFLHSMRPNAGVWPENVPDEWKQPLGEEELARLAAMDLVGAPHPWYVKNACFRRDFATGQMSRDMTLFVDDDGNAYHLHAAESNGTLHISLLSDDYLTPAGRYIRVFPGRFHEAPSLMKWKGRYWLFSSDCTGWAPNTARLSSAPTIWGPWEEHGNPCLGPGWRIANCFESQPTFMLPVQGKPDAFIFMADRWRPENAIDGRYVWLPVIFRHDTPVLEWRESWDLSVFD